MVASTVFLISFLLSGVLTDYKESEKIPGQIATSLETLDLEIRAIAVYNPRAEIDASIHAVVGLGWVIQAWLHEKIDTQDVYLRAPRKIKKSLDSGIILIIIS